MGKAIISGLFLIFTAGLVHATGTAGSLDTGFDGDGLRIDDFGFEEQAFGVVEQSNGKLVAVGVMRHATGPNPEDEVIDWGVARYNSDGSLDTTFGSGGSTSPLATDEHGNAIDVALDASGRIVAVGHQRVRITTTSGRGKKQKTTTTIEQHVAVVRLDTDGSLDTSFGDNGVVLTEIPNSDFPLANSVVVLDDGDLLVAGQGKFTQPASGKGRNRIPETTSEGAILLRYDSDGTLDTAFGDGGIVVDDFTTGNDAVTMRGLGVQSDDRIVVAGRFGTLRRYESDGTLDTSFGTDGTTTATHKDVYGGFVIDGSDRILVGGYREFEPFTRDGLVARFTADGAADWTYLTALSGIDSLGSVAVAPDGAIVSGGTIEDDGEWDGYVVRLTSAGVADSSFGLGGLADLTTPGDGGLDLASDVIVDANGDVVLVGAIGIPNGGVLDWLVARYCGN